MNDGRRKEEESSTGPPAASSRDTSLAARDEFNAPAIRVREIPEQTVGRKTLLPLLDVHVPRETRRRFGCNRRSLTGQGPCLAWSGIWWNLAQIRSI